MSRTADERADPGQAGSSLDACEANLDSLVKDSPAELGPRTHLAEYLANFTYRLGPEEVEAAARFHDILAEHEIPCTAG